GRCPPVGEAHLPGVGTGADDEGGLEPTPAARVAEIDPGPEIPVAERGEGRKPRLPLRARPLEVAHHGGSLIPPLRSNPRLGADELELDGPALGTASVLRRRASLRPKGHGTRLSFRPLLGEGEGHPL